MAEGIVNSCSVEVRFVTATASPHRGVAKNLHLVCHWPCCWDCCSGLRSAGHTGAPAVVCLRLFDPFCAKKNFRILVALLREAANTMREMPSLLLAPFILTCSMVAVSLLFLWAAWLERFSKSA